MAVAGLRYHLSHCFAVPFSVTTVCLHKSLPLSLPSFCSPFGQFRIEAFHNPVHLAAEVRALGVMAHHFDGLLTKRIGDRAFVKPALAKDDGYRMPQTIEGQTGADGARPLKINAQCPP